jgi:hypothetical protein
MRLSTLLLIGGVLGIVFGLGFLLVPASVLPMYGVQTDPPVVLMSRFFGAALFQLGSILYLGRGTTEPGAQRALIVAGVLGSVAGLAVAVLGRLNGLVNAMGWSTVVIYGFLLIGYLMHFRTGSRAP